VARSLVLVILLSVLSVSALSRERLVFSSLQGIDGVEMAVIMLQEVYDPLNIDIEVKYYPPARSIVMANKGEVDGELARMVNMEKEFTNLIPVPVAFYSLNYHAYSTRVFFKPKGWQSLKPFHIGFTTGNKIMHQKLATYKVTNTAKLQQLWNLLQFGRLDVVVATHLEGLAKLSRGDNPHVTMLEPAIASVPFYHYLFKKHQALVPELVKSINKMKKQGRFRQLYLDFIKKNYPLPE